MKSVKPGRGPSWMGSFASLAVAIFGVIWIIAAQSMGAPAIFPLFGIVFVIVAVVQGVYNISNATRKNRFSEYDVVNSQEEPDPLNAKFQQDAPGAASKETTPAKYCPYCGAPLEGAYNYCPKCGKELPKA